jgi:hypothetical protein
MALWLAIEDQWRRVADLGRYAAPDPLAVTVVKSSRL